MNVIIGSIERRKVIVDLEDNLAVGARQNLTSADVHGPGWPGAFLTSVTECASDECEKSLHPRAESFSALGEPSG